MSSAVFLNSSQTGCDMALIIINTAAIHIAITNIQLEGRASPRLVFIGRLHIVVIVKNQGLRICFYTGKGSHNKRSCIGFIQDDLGTSILQDLLEIASCFSQTRLLGKDASLSNQLFQNRQVVSHNSILFNDFQLFHTFLPQNTNTACLHTPIFASM